MSHPDPRHDRKNEYPSDGYRPAGKKKRSHPDAFRAALRKEDGNVKRAMSDGGIEKPIKRMLDLSDIGGKVGAKAQAIKKKLK